MGGAKQADESTARSPPPPWTWRAARAVRLGEWRASEGWQGRRRRAEDGGCIQRGTDRRHDRGNGKSARADQVREEVCLG